MDRWLNQRRRFGVKSNVVSFLLTLLVLVPGLAMAISANPEPFFEDQGDGVPVALRAYGDEHFSWLEDAAGYTVIRKNGWLHYAEIGADGKLVPGVLLVGQDDPAAYGLEKRILPAADVRAQSARLMPVPSPGTYSLQNMDGPAQIAPLGTVKNLVVMIRFADHAGRSLPPVSEYETLFNAVGGDPVVAPTGSVRDVYLENSYGQLTLDSDLSGWIQVSGTESYYANNSGGDSTLWEALNEALGILDQTTDFNQYDSDNDGYIDSIAFIHSGYGAEWGGVLTRIWSHRWAIQNPSGGWQSNEGVRVFDYHISTGLWGTSGVNIGRIGVIAHETGHFFGLPDLYDTHNGTNGELGSGIGSWGLMANSWDFDSSQLCPPHFTAWSKDQLGWYTPTVISADGEYTINQAETNPEAYKIQAGFPSGEYLMIENRQNAGFDCTIPQGGLLIWHIDDARGSDWSTQGYPGQTNWPQNGAHYRVALLQADGLYDLEHNIGRGDPGDVHRGGGGVDAITTGPDGHPNTDTYQSGIINSTGHTISNISASGPSMTFCLGTCNPIGPAAPSALDAVTASTTQIDLTWSDNANNEDSYRLERGLDGVNFPTTTNLAANSTSYSDTGLANTTTFYYRVVAINTIDESVSNIASATTGTPSPEVDYVANSDQYGSGEVFGTYVATQADGGAVQEFREKVSGGKKRDRTTYMGHFWRFNIGSGDEITVSANAWRSATSDGDNFIFAWSDDDQTYHDLFTVSGENSNDIETGTIPNSVSGNVWIRVIDTDRTPGNSSSRDMLFVDHLFIRVINNGPPTVPDPPTGLAAVSTGKTSINLSWTDASNNEDGFRVDRSSDGVNWSFLANVGTNVDAYSDSGLTPNTTYHYQVRAFNGVGNSSYSNADSATTDEDLPLDPPAAPTNLGAASAGPNSIDLTWTDIANNETGYFIQRSSDGINFATVASVGVDTEAYTNTGLAANELYYYQVYAYNGDGDSGLSNVASATTDEPSVSLILSANGRKEKGKHVIDLTWTGGSGSNVDIVRNGSTVATTGNDGAYSDATGSKTRGVTYTHKVCEEGSTTVCSNETQTSY